MTAHVNQYICLTFFSQYLLQTLCFRSIMILDIFISGGMSPPLSHFNSSPGDEWVHHYVHYYDQLRYLYPYSKWKKLILEVCRVLLEVCGCETHAKQQRPSLQLVFCLTILGNCRNITLAKDNSFHGIVH